MAYGHAALLAARCFYCSKIGAHFLSGEGNLCCATCSLLHEDD